MEEAGQGERWGGDRAPFRSRAPELSPLRTVRSPIHTPWRPVRLAADDAPAGGVTAVTGRVSAATGGVSGAWQGPFGVPGPNVRSGAETARRIVRHRTLPWEE